MGKTIVKTFEEIDREWPPEKMKAMIENAPSFPDDITDEDRATGRVRRIPGRGFAAVMEYINSHQNERPESGVKEDVPVGMRVPEKVVA